MSKKWGAVDTTGKLVHSYEMLDAIEKASGNDKVTLLKKYGAIAPLSFLLSLNFRSDITLDLPDGMPPLDPKEMDSATHPDMMGNLGSSIHRLKNCMPNTNLKPFKKQDIFIQVLLSCPLKDAEIVCSAKDKALEELYPSITTELVKSVFPAYVK